jgi:hypothetical protein
MDLLDWGDISIGVYVVLVLVGIIMHQLIFNLDNYIGKKYAKYIHNYTEQCAVNCSNKEQCNYINSFRDDHYYVFDGNVEKCLVTKWEISHFITHVFLGYFTNIYISQGVSVGFELYEHHMLDCGSYLDLIYNFTGFIIGHTIKNYYK